MDGQGRAALRTRAPSQRAAPPGGRFHQGPARAVLMGNAHPDLKAALPGLPVIGSHQHEAVAHYLAGLFR